MVWIYYSVIQRKIARGGKWRVSILLYLSHKDSLLNPVTVMLTNHSRV